MRASYGRWINQLSPRFALILAMHAIALCPSWSQTILGIADGRHDSPAPFTAIDDAGANIFFVSTEDIQSLNPQREPVLYRHEVATATTSRVTPHPVEWIVESQTVSVSDDGVWLTFISRANPFGTNDDRSPELFVIQSDGSNLTQITSDPSADSGTVSQARISGSANRVVFVSNANYGSNSQRINQVFVVDRDGSNLAQLTNALDQTIRVDVSISDDGSKIVFNHRSDLLGTNSELNSEIFAIEANGTGLRQLTSAPSGESSWAQISGNGSRITFHADSVLHPDDDDTHFSIYTVLWDGTGLDLLAQGITGHPFARPTAVQYPSITDDAVTVFYTDINLSGDTTISRIAADGSEFIGTTIFETPFLIPGLIAPMISGDGSKIAFFEWTYFDQFGTLPNITPQITMTDADGSNDVHLTNGSWSQVTPRDLSPDGSTILAMRNRNDTFYREVWIVESDGTSTVVPGMEGGVPYSIASDNSTLLVDDQGLKVLQRDGTGIVNMPVSGSAQLSNDGLKVLVVQNGDETDEIFVMNSDGTGLEQVTNLVTGQIRRARFDATGTWIAFDTDGDPAGGNSDGSYEVFRIRSDGMMLEQLSDDPVLDSGWPDISSNGDRVIYVSQADPLGTNADNSSEIFMVQASSSTTSQITQLTSDVAMANISGNGTWSTFYLDEDVYETNVDRTEYVFRVNNDTGDLQRLDSERTARLVGGFNYWKPNAVFFATGPGLAPPIDESGDRVAFSRYPFAADPDVEGNIRFVDMSARPSIMVSGEAPTSLDWGPIAGSVRYDVIRGDVSQIVLMGADVDLGPVLCIEEDSPDSDTEGFEDTSDPNEGNVFFYLYRGSPGLSAGPGSWGTSSSGQERIAGSGSCS